MLGFPRQCCIHRFQKFQIRGRRSCSVFHLRSVLQLSTFRIDLIRKSLPLWPGLLDVKFPSIHVDGDKHFFHLFPLRIVLWLWIGQRFLAAFLHFGHFMTVT